MTRGGRQAFLLGRRISATALALFLVVAFTAAPTPLAQLSNDGFMVSGYATAWARKGGDGDGGDHGDSGGDDGDSGGDDGDRGDGDRGDNGDSDGDGNSGSDGHGEKDGKGGKGEGRNGGDDSDSGGKTGKSDKNGKTDKTDKNDKTGTPDKDKATEGKDKSQKKGKTAAKPSVQLTVETVPTAPSANSDGGSSAAGGHKAGEVVGVGMTSADVATVSALGFTVATPTTAVTTPVVQILVPEGVDEDDARAALAKALPGRRFGLNRVYSGYATANSAKAATGKTRDGTPGADPRCTGDQCYGRAMIGWQAALEGCQAGVSIGMIDTGIDVDHPAFAGGAMIVKRFSPQSAKEEVHGHATGVAALLIGNGRGASPGLLPKARLVAADVFYVDGKHVVTDTASLLRALEWLDQAGVGIVNMSFSGPQDPLVAEAIQRMSRKGVVFVAAAGNNGAGAPAAYPAAYPDVIAVTAVDARMKSYVKANQGDYIDVAAPGVKIWTATANGKSGYQSGTSFAVPFVTAALAAGSAYGAPDAAENWLATAGIDDIGELGIDSVFGRGLLKAPAGCSEPASGSGLFSAFLPDGTSETAGPIRVNLGMAQR